MQNVRNIKKTEFALIHIEHNIAKISECIDLANRIDACINRGQTFLVLHFDENAFVTGSLLGFLTARINTIKKKHGDIVVVASNPELLDLLRLTSLDALIHIFPTVKNFLSAFPDVDFKLG
jgi:anti-anti-sigma factor